MHCGTYRFNVHSPQAEDIYKDRVIDQGVRVIGLSNFKSTKKSVLKKAGARKEYILGLPRSRKFGVQQLISNVLAEKLPLPLKRLFK